MEECVATSVTFFSSITANHIQSLICLIGGASCLIPLVITPLVDYEKSTLLDALLSQRFKDSALFTMTFTLPVLLDIVFEVVQSLTIKQKQDKAKLSIKDALLNTTERFVLYCGIVTVPSIAFMPVDTQNLANIYLCLKRSRSVLVFGTVVTSLCRYNVKMWTVKRSYLLLLLLVVATFSGAYADNTSMNTAISISHNISVSLYVVTGSLFLYCNGSWICSNAFKWLSGTSRTSDPDLSDEFIGHRQTNTIFPLVFATATSVISIVAMGSARSYTGDKKYSEADLFYQNLFIALYLLMLMYISERMLKYEVVQGLCALIESKKVYVRYISHELRTPLNSAFLGLKVVSDDLASSQRAEDLERFETLLDVRSACRIAVEILNDLLCFDKLESGILELHKNEVPVIPFISDCVEMFSSQAREEGVTITNITNNWVPSSDVRLNIPELSLSLSQKLSGSAHAECISDFDTVSVDKFKMDQVLRNLISNALKFTPRGGSVTVCASFIADDVTELPQTEAAQNAETKSRAPMSFLARIPFFKHLSGPVKAESSLNALHNDLELGGVGSRGTEMKSSHDHTGRASTAGGNKYSAGEMNNRAQTLNPLIDKDEWGSEAVNNAYMIEGAEGNPLMVDTSSHLDPNARRLEKGKLRIVVADSGVGISPENQKRLFKEIVQFNPDVLQAGGGSGLGLWITSSIVRMHSGVIRAYSAGVNKGSTFTVEVDMQRSHPAARLAVLMEPNYPPDPVPRGRVMGSGIKRHDSFSPNVLDSGSASPVHVQIPHSPASTADFSSPVDLIHQRQTSVKAASALLDSAFTTAPEVLKPVDDVYDVLVVDDSNLNRKMLCKLLKTAKYTCDEASDGLIAVEKVKERMTREGGMNYFDAILMDFVMPNMDGPTATEVIRGLGYSGPIFGVTGNALDSDIEFFIKSGVYAVLPKPFDFSRFKEMMKDIRGSSS